MEVDREKLERLCKDAFDALAGAVEYAQWLSDPESPEASFWRPLDGAPGEVKKLVSFLAMEGDDFLKQAAMLLAVL